MRHLFFLSFFLLLSGGLDKMHAQETVQLSQNLASGIAELRHDIFTRKKAYNKRIQEIVMQLDSSSMKEGLKKEIHQFIKRDVEAGAPNNNLNIYLLLPENHPFKNTYIEQYITNNEDFQIDRDIIIELTQDKILTEDGKINGQRLEEIKNDFEFIDIAENDHLLLYKTKKSLYPLLLGYTYEGIEIVLHNYNLFDHYTALDRIDRYPNINNGNSIEFLHNGDDPRLVVKKEQWNKIIVRGPSLFEQGPIYILKSFHDNLTKDGYLYIRQNVQSDNLECRTGLTKNKIIKIAQRADFKLIDQLDMGCQTYFKFQSIKE